MNKRKTILSILSYFIIIIAIVLTVFPIYWTFITSFKTPVDIYEGNPLLPPTKPIFTNYMEVFLEKYVVDAIGNSVIVVLSTTFISLLLGILAAYSIYRFKFKGKRTWFIGVIIIRTLPPVVSLIPFYILFTRMGLIDTKLGLILSYSSFTLPFVIWMTSGFFKEIPKDIEESARVDGASWFVALFRIMIPLAAPGIVATAIFSVIGAWNEYIIATIITQTAKSQTVPIVLGFQVTNWGIYWGKICALSFFMLIPVMIFAFFIQRYMARGLTAGALKE